MSLFQQKIEGVPQFVSYFIPVRDALLHFGGQATARQVYDYIALHGGFTNEELSQSNHFRKSRGLGTLLPYESGLDVFAKARCMGAD
jgi:hypothetical protein